MSTTAALRSLLDADGLVVVPGVHDALSARVADRVGFDAVAMTGNGATFSRLGRPDVGTSTVVEMAEHARRIQEAVDVPVVADADNGYGNAVNTVRTVREFAAAGVAGVHIEDQVFPKRCGFVEGKRVVSTEEAVGKFRAAADARDDAGSDLVVIARTDVRGTAGGTIEAAIDRVRAYLEAGADVGFVMGAADADELAAVAGAVDAPLLYNVSGGSPVVPLETAEAMGYDLAMFPRLSTLPAITALFEAYGQLRDEGMAAWTDAAAAFDAAPVESYDHLTGVPEVLAWEREYLPGA